MNPRFWFAAAVASMPLATAPAFAASDLNAGAAKAASCAACHGAAGISSTAGTPSLAGQPDNFLQWQLVYFRNGVRKSPVMQPMAASLSDDDIRNVAAWFAAQKPPAAAANGPADPALRAAGAKLAQGNRCAACHKDDFSGAPQQATPRLAGQREDYLLKALREFKAGTRVGGGVAAMADVVQPLGDADLKTLAHFMAHFP
jgi:cytochrome c553